MAMFASESAVQNKEHLSAQWELSKSQLGLQLQRKLYEQFPEPQHLALHFEFRH